MPGRSSRPPTRAGAEQGAGILLGIRMNVYSCEQTLIQKTDGLEIWSLGGGGAPNLQSRFGGPKLPQTLSQLFNISGGYNGKSKTNKDTIRATTDMAKPIAWGIGEMSVLGNSSTQTFRQDDWERKSHHKGGFKR